MNVTTPLVAAVIAAVCALGPAKPGTQATRSEGLAETYENLATAIIALRNTETSLVREILNGHYRNANEYFGQVISDDLRRKSHLERAAQEITNIAMEGDKAIQAVRQRLLKAGHHHHTDAETEEDYIFVDSDEKAELLDLARRVSRMADASDQDVRQAQIQLSAVFSKAMTPG